MILGAVEARSAESDSKHNDPRILPIRGERFSKVLTEHRMRIDALSISADGSKIAFIERPGSEHQAQARKALGIVVFDVKSERRFDLSAEEWQDDGWGTLELRWSKEGRFIAGLERRPASVGLVVWDIARERQVASAPRVPLDVGVLRDCQIVDWRWQSDSRQITLVARSFAEEGPAREDAKISTANRLRGFTWFLSRFDAAQGAGAWTTEEHASGGLKLFSFDYATQKVQEVVLERPLIPDMLSNFQRTRWSTDRAKLYVSTVDPQVQQQGGWVINFQKWLAATDDPRADLYRRARSYVWSIDTSSGALRRRYIGSPALVGAVAEIRNKDDLVVLEGEFALGVWPTSPFYNDFGRLRRIRGSEIQSEPISSQPLLMRSELIASDQPGGVFIYEPAAPEARILELQLSTGHIERISPAGYSASKWRVSQKGSAIAAVLENVNAAPDVYVWTRSQPTWRRLTRYAERIARQNIIWTQRVTWRSKDNRFDVDGFVIKPADFNPSQKYPALVLIHGGPHASNTNEFDLGAEYGLGTPQVLASEGYVVLLPNYRGDSGYSPDFSHAARGHLSDTYVQDIDAGVDYLISKGWIDRDKIGIMGHSAGGLQLAYALSHTTRYRAAVASDAPGFLPDVWTAEQETQTSMPMGSPFGYEGMRIILGVDPVQSAWADPARSRTPLLMRWGLPAANPTREGLYGLPYEDWGPIALYTTKRLSLIMKRNQVPFEAIIDRDIHVVTNPTYLIEWQSRLLQWFDYFLLSKGSRPIPAMESPFQYE